MSRLTFQQLREANKQRLPQFKDKHGRLAHPRLIKHGDDCGLASFANTCGSSCRPLKSGSDWSLGEWICALAGEVGEAANIIKKIRRGDVTIDEVREELAAELADIQIYLDILAYQCDIDLGAATITKFNQVSLRVKADVFIDPGSGDPTEATIRACKKKLAEALDFQIDASFEALCEVARKHREQLWQVRGVVG